MWGNEKDTEHHAKEGKANQGTVEGTGHELGRISSGLESDHPQDHNYREGNHLPDHAMTELAVTLVPGLGLGVVENGIGDRLKGVSNDDENEPELEEPVGSRLFGLIQYGFAAYA